MFPHLLALSLAVLLAGCAGGEREIADVRSCLKEAGMKAVPFDKQEDDVEEGVLATTDLSKGDQQRFTLAVAAYVKSEKTVKKFQEDVRSFTKALSVGDQKLVIDSDVDGRYVWVVTGKREDKVYKAAVDCVS